MSPRARWVGAASLACALLLVLARANGPWLDLQEPSILGPPRDVARGVALYHVTDPQFVNPAAPLSIWILRVDPAAADLRPALAHDRIMDSETVPGIAERHGAIAAVNAGFFLQSGEPAGIFKLEGQLVSDTRRPRGAVGISRTVDPPRLIFGRVAATLALRVRQADGPDRTVEIAGVDSTRLLGRLMLFTPVYHAHTDTAPGGLEWTVEGDPLRVTEKPRSQGKTPIPRAGFVLSFGGRDPPDALASLQPGSEVAIDIRYLPAEGSAEDWSSADDIVGGAGLLARDGAYVEDWSPETFASGFAENRHPRTMIGTKADGSVWLVAVDGRQPDLSAGMTLIELREFARALGLNNALNLDGGGSTTMWVAGHVVNSPSDAAGLRRVSDALVVLPHQP